MRAAYEQVVTRRGVLLSALAASLPARRAAASNFTPRISTSKFTATYSDDLHPHCDRVITIERTPRGDVAHFTMSDVGPPGIGNVVNIACDNETEQKYGLRRWSFDARIDGSQIDAGDGVHIGQFHMPSKDDAEQWEGIRWRDGNRWIKLRSASAN